MSNDGLELRIFTNQFQERLKLYVRLKTIINCSYPDKNHKTSILIDHWRGFYDLFAKYRIQQKKRVNVCKLLEGVQNRVPTRLETKTLPPM